VEKKTETLEHFKTAIGSTVKSLSNSEDIEISFGNQNTKIKKNTIRLPDIEKIDNKINFKQIRALADSESLKIRYSNLKTFKLYEPKGNISKKLYRIAEKVRYEKLGSEKFIGVKNNIQQYYEERLNSLDLKSSEDKITESFENFLRENFFNFKNNKELNKRLKVYKKDLNENFKSKIKELNNLTIDQKKYNSLISNLISKMNLDESLEDDEKKNEDNKDEKPQKPQNQEQKTDKQEKEQQEMSIESGVPGFRTTD
jgi:Cobalamin biosynthesis protein CobT (nicotinate-mononucleotide:5, 6-dimethylbenzimidazole phosphoribosyltransferase)